MWVKVLEEGKAPPSRRPIAATQEAHVSDDVLTGDTADTPEDGHPLLSGTAGKSTVGTATGVPSAVVLKYGRVKQ